MPLFTDFRGDPEFLLDIPILASPGSALTPTGQRRPMFRLILKPSRRGRATSGIKVGSEEGADRASGDRRGAWGRRQGLQATPPVSPGISPQVSPFLSGSWSPPAPFRPRRDSRRSQQTPHGGAALGLQGWAGEQSLRATLPRVQVALSPSGAASTSTPRPGPARLHTLSARWWTRPRPGSASSCSSPSSGSSRKPASSRGERGPEGPTGAWAAMFVPASPAAPPTSGVKGRRPPEGPGSGGLGG